MHFNIINYFLTAILLAQLFLGSKKIISIPFPQTCWSLNSDLVHIHGTKHSSKKRKQSLQLSIILQ